MARPQKATVDYFPHDCNQKKTLFILKSRYGNDGYAFWFQLLELLGRTDNHFIDCNDKASWLFLTAETGVNDDTKATEMLNLLSEMKAIDQDLWETRIIWSDNFVNNIADAYRRRKQELPQKPVIAVSNDINDDINSINDDGNPQSILKKTKVKETKPKDYSHERLEMFKLIIEYLNKITGKGYKFSSKAHREHINARLNEGFIVEDFYKVVDTKAKQWLDTKDDKFLRPETLFGNKFDGYLNETGIKYDTSTSTSKIAKISNSKDPNFYTEGIDG